MRYFELQESDPISVGLYDPAQDHTSGNLSDNGKPRLTLLHLNKLKHIRNRRRQDLQRKLEFLPSMYANGDVQEVSFELQKRELEQVKDEIALEIDKAEISADAKAHISSLALRAIEQRRKL